MTEKGTVVSSIVQTFVCTCVKVKGSHWFCHFWRLNCHFMLSEI